MNLTGVSSIGAGSISRNEGYKWTLAVIPDTQELAASNPSAYTTLINYVIAQKTARNIQMVMHVGDVVDNGGSGSQWNTAETALSALDGAIPYLIGIGNHDYDDDSGASRTATEFESAFPLATYQGHSWFIDDTYPTDSTANIAAKQTINGVTYLFISVEYRPRAEALTWAQSIIDGNTDADHTFVMTHYLNEFNNSRANDQTVIDFWEDFAAQNPHIDAVFCGHAGAPNAVVSQQRTDNGIKQFLFNAQSRSGNSYANSAFVRFYEINQSGHVVSVESINPVITSETLTDSANQFTFKL